MSFKSTQSASRVCTCNLPAPGFSLRPIVYSDFTVVVALVAKLHLTLSQPHGLVALPGSSVREISQARRLEWVAISSSRESSWLRDQTHDSWINRQIFYHWATWKARSIQLRTGFSKDCLIKRWAKDLNRHLTDTERYRWYLYIFNTQEKKKFPNVNSEFTRLTQRFAKAVRVSVRENPMLTQLLWTRSWEVRELLDIRVTGIVSW